MDERTYRRPVTVQTMGSMTSSHVDSSNYQLPKHETLAANPHDTFQNVCDMLGFGYEYRAVDTVRDEAVYSMSDIPMRHKTGEIMLDEKWKALR